jgi:hypothetical protein
MRVDTYGVSGGQDGDEDREVTFRLTSEDSSLLDPTSWSLVADDGAPNLAARPPRRRSPWLTTGVALSLAGLLIVALNARQAAVSRVRRSPIAPTSVATPPDRQQPIVAQKGERVDVGPGSPIGMAMGKYALFVLLDAPPRVAAVSWSGVPVEASALPRPRLIAVDDPNSVVWVVSDGSGKGATLRAYDANSLTHRTDVVVPFAVSAVAVLDGVLFMGGPDGVFEMGSVTARLLPVRYAGLRNVRSITVDPGLRWLIISSTDDPLLLRVLAVGRFGVLDGPRLAMDNVTVAVVLSQIWIAGSVGRAGQVVRLDPGTLLPAPADEVSKLVSRSSIVWPGDFDVWALAPDDGTLLCVDAISGEAIAQWAGVQGPVVSSAGIVGRTYAIDRGRVITLQRPPGCLG